MKRDGADNELRTHHPRYLLHCLTPQIPPADFFASAASPLSLFPFPSAAACSIHFSFLPFRSWLFLFLRSPMFSPFRFRFSHSVRLCAASLNRRLLPSLNAFLLPCSLPRARRLASLALPHCCSLCCRHGKHTAAFLLCLLLILASRPMHPVCILFSAVLPWLFGRRAAHTDRHDST